MAPSCYGTSRHNCDVTGPSSMHTLTGQKLFSLRKMFSDGGPATPLGVIFIFAAGKKKQANFLTQQLYIKAIGPHCVRGGAFRAFDADVRGGKPGVVVGDGGGGGGGSGGSGDVSRAASVTPSGGSGSGSGGGGGGGGFREPPPFAGHAGEGSVSAVASSPRNPSRQGDTNRCDPLPHVIPSCQDVRCCLKTHKRDQEWTQDFVRADPPGVPIRLRQV